VGFVSPLSTSVNVRDYAYGIQFKSDVVTLRLTFRIDPGDTERGRKTISAVVLTPDVLLCATERNVNTPLLEARLCQRAGLRSGRDIRALHAHR